MAVFQGKPKRLTIGLTGSFGSGKSTVAEIWRSLGVQVIDCDRLVREVYLPNHLIGARIKKTFSLALLGRSLIADIIFRNAKMRKKLEGIVHPYVFKRIREELKRYARGIVAIEVPLLFETGFNNQVDLTVLVRASGKVIQERLQEKGFSREMIQLRQKAQWSLSRKMRKADFIINNSGSFQGVKKQAVMFLKLFKKEFGF